MTESHGKTAHGAGGQMHGNADSKERRRWFGARVAACTAAKLGGWFWLPCPVCGEYKDDDGRSRHDG